MRPATPQAPEHDAACPLCGEPFKARKVAGIRMGEYACHRCRTNFALFHRNYYLAGKPIPSWVGPPLPATGGKQ